jgi:hypothetical protein
VLSVLAGGDVEDEDGDDAGEDAEAAARAFLGDESFALLSTLDAAED